MKALRTLCEVEGCGEDKSAEIRGTISNRVTYKIDLEKKKKSKEYIKPSREFVFADILITNK